MIELRPLLESTSDDLERALLMSARAELPSGLGLRDTALALGLAAPTAQALATSLTAASSLSHGAPLASATAATAAATTSATSGGAASALATASLGIAGKSLLGGALVSFLALTTVDYSIRSSPSRPDPIVVARGAVARVPDAPPALPGPAISPVSPDAASAPVGAAAVVGVAARSALSRLEPPVRAPARAPAPVNAPSSAAFALPPQPEQPPQVTLNGSLAAEIRLLDQARSALAAGDSSLAAVLLDRYAANRPSAVLAQEAALLRVRLLLKQGDRASAGRLARRIIHQHPESTHVESLRSLAAEP
jgi:hypothetical protein